MVSLQLRKLQLDLRTGVRILGVLFNFTIGFVSSEDSDRSKTNDVGSSTPELFASHILASSKFPTVVAFLKIGVEPPNDRVFSSSLEWILNGLAKEIQAPTARRTASKERQLKASAPIRKAYENSRKESS